MKKSKIKFSKASSVLFALRVDQIRFLPVIFVVGSWDVLFVLRD